MYTQLLPFAIDGENFKRDICSQALRVQRNDDDDDDDDDNVTEQFTKLPSTTP